MVAAVSETPNFNNNNGSNTPPSSSPSAPGKKPDANNVRKPRAKHVASRYLSSSPSTSSSTTTTSGATVSSSSSSSSAARRFESPLPAIKRSQSAERRRPGDSANAGGELSTAAKLLVSSTKGLVSTSTKSLSVSFQGKSFSLPVSKEKAANNAVILKKTERKRVASTGTATARDPSESSNGKKTTMIMDQGDGSESVAAASAADSAAAGILSGSKASKDFSVFPPSNHENLHLLPPPAPSLSTQSSSSASNFSYSSPSSSSSASSLAFSSYSDAEYEECDDPCPPKPPIRVSVPGRDGPGLLRIGIGPIRSKVLRETRFILGSSGSIRGRVLCSVGALMATAAWVWCLYVRIRFRRRWMRLVQGIRERDEKIVQLLHQIAQMNEVLLMKHKDLSSRLRN